MVAQYDDDDDAENVDGSVDVCVVDWFCRQFGWRTRI